MIDTEALRKKVIDLAIQGKLTEQLPSDGDAETLYAQILDHKSQLIKEGKIKKDKALPDIAADEIPFEIPDNWKWVRFIDISTIINGDRGKNYPAKSTLSLEGIPFISALNLNGVGVDDDDRLMCLSEEQYDKLGSGKLRKNDIVICIRGSLGKHGRYPFEKGAIASSLVICRPHCYETEIGGFIMKWLDSSMFPREIDKYDGGSAQPNLAAENLKKFLIPLPPIEEQVRIIDTLDEVLTWIDIIDDLQAKYSNDLVVLKSKIIDAGIQGKLTEQLPEDGDAEDLYAQILNQKSQLIKEGKIKKEKPLPDITADEIPFEIPKNWKWVRFGDLYSLTNGIASRGSIGGTLRPVLRLADLVGGEINTKNVREIKLTDTEFESHKINSGDIIFIRVNGSRDKVANAFLYCGDNEVSYCDHLFSGRKIYDEVDSSYIMFVYRSDMAKKQVDPEIKTTAGQNTINQNGMGKILIPLPPISEQKRIAKKIAELHEVIS